MYKKIILYNNAAYHNVSFFYNGLMIGNILLFQNIKGMMTVFITQNPLLWTL